MTRSVAWRTRTVPLDLPPDRRLGLPRESSYDLRGLAVCRRVDKRCLT